MQNAEKTKETPPNPSPEGNSEFPFYEGARGSFGLVAAESRLRNRRSKVWAVWLKYSDS